MRACALLVLAATVIWAAAITPYAPHAEAATLPSADCGEDAAQSTSATIPLVTMWFGGDLEDWLPPACTGWTARPFTVLVETWGRTGSRASTDAMLARLGQIADMKEIQYWSTTRDRWRALVPDAAALNSPDPDDRRPAGFTASELRSGVRYFWQAENTPLGEVTYALTVRHADETRIVVAIANALPARASVFSRLPPGHHEFLYVFRRKEGNPWTIYGLMRTGTGPNLIAQTGRKSYGNRAVALFRYFADEPTDLAPPLFP